MDFFVHLRHDKGLSVSAGKGHRSAFNSVFALKGMDLVDSRPVSMLKSVRPEELCHPRPSELDSGSVRAAADFG